jgi:hypothetical protein
VLLNGPGRWETMVGHLIASETGGIEKAPIAMGFPNERGLPSRRRLYLVPTRDGAPLSIERCIQHRRTMLEPWHDEKLCKDSWSVLRPTTAAGSGALQPFGT